MDRKDAQKVIDNLQQKPFICGGNEIIVSGGYVILKKESYESLKEKSEKKR